MSCSSAAFLDGLLENEEEDDDDDDDSSDGAERF
jgi:hypothetical protein